MSGQNQTIIEPFIEPFSPKFGTDDIKQHFVIPYCSAKKRPKCHPLTAWGVHTKTKLDLYFSLESYAL